MQILLERKGQLFFLLLAVVYVILSINSIAYGGDFEVYLDAAERLQRKENIYTAPYFKGLQYYYSPLFAFVLIPFSSNWFISEFLWLLLSGLLFVRTCFLIRHYFDLSVLSRKEVVLWMGILTI
ncbi:MAG: hypothetical protein AAF990_02255 [Bacteroidota bacterium]